MMTAMCVCVCVWTTMGCPSLFTIAQLSHRHTHARVRCAYLYTWFGLAFKLVHSVFSPHTIAVKGIMGSPDASHTHTHMRRVCACMFGNKPV